MNCLNFTGRTASQESQTYIYVRKRSFEHYARAASFSFGHLIDDEFTSTIITWLDLWTMPSNYVWKSTQVSYGLKLDSNWISWTRRASFNWDHSRNEWDVPMGLFHRNSNAILRVDLSVWNIKPQRSSNVSIFFVWYDGHYLWLWPYRSRWNYRRYLNSQMELWRCTCVWIAESSTQFDLASETGQFFTLKSSGNFSFEPNLQWI